MSRDNAWMPLYVADYLADTMHLTGPEHGAYLLLLMHAWRSGPLPAEERKLAAIARTDLKAWREMCETILAFFTMTDDGLVQMRLERTRAEQGAKIEQRRAAGKASAEARKGQRNSNERSTNVDAPLPPRARELELEEEKKEHPSQPSVGRSPRGSRLPADWSPDAELRQFATALGLDAERVAANFRDYWHAKAGKDAVKLDWPATWRGWCRREAERGSGRNGHAAAPAKPKSVIGQWADLMRSEAPPAFDLDGSAEEIPH